MDFDLEAVIDLYQNNDIFKIQETMIQRHLLNCFEGTDPNEPVMGTLLPIEPPKATITHRRKTKHRIEISEPIEEKVNGYDAVIDYDMPETTDIIDDFLGMVVRYSVISSREFYTTLQRVKNKDSSIMSKVLTPKD